MKNSCLVLTRLNTFGRFGSDFSRWISAAACDFEVKFFAMTRAFSDALSFRFHSANLQTLFLGARNLRLARRWIAIKSDFQMLNKVSLPSKFQWFRENFARWLHFPCLSLSATSILYSRGSTTYFTRSLWSFLLKELLQQKLYICTFAYPWPGDCCYEEDRI